MELMLSSWTQRIFFSREHSPHSSCIRVIHNDVPQFNWQHSWVCLVWLGKHHSHWKHSVLLCTQRSPVCTGTQHGSCVTTKSLHETHLWFSIGRTEHSSEFYPSRRGTYFYKTIFFGFLKRRGVLTHSSWPSFSEVLKYKSCHSCCKMICSWDLQ